MIVLHYANEPVATGKFESHVSKFYWKSYFWSNSYLILTTGGATIDVIKKYIQDQDNPK